MEKPYNEYDEIEEGMVFDRGWGWRSREWLTKKKDKFFRKRKSYQPSFDYGELDYGANYDYGFDGSVSQGKAPSAWDYYQSTGEWRGYNFYRKSTVDYRYIEQMANAFSAQHDIKVTLGEYWAIDLENKELTYSPTSLMFGTKADVIVSLLHEIGHLRHTTQYEKLAKTGLAQKYPDAAFEVLNCFEDFRIDNYMVNSYSGSGDVYEANKRMVGKIVEKLKQKEKAIKERAKQSFNLITELKNAKERGREEEYLRESCDTYRIDYEKVKKLLELDQHEFVEKLMDMNLQAQANANIFQYGIGITVTAYGYPESAVPEGIRKCVAKTKHVIPLARNFDDTQKVFDCLEKEVFPHIEDLMKKYEKGDEQDRKIFGDQGAERIQRGNRKSYFSKYEMEVRDSGAGAGGDFLPEEWKKGDYPSLKESVNSAIKELIKKLRNVRAKDLSLRWKKDLRAGKLDIKSVYRYPADRFDFFKKKIVTTDRVRNFAFSVLLDSSGSMGGKRIISATRGLIILSEVFSQLDIPFEVIPFNSDAYRIKEFSGKYDSKAKKMVGSLARSSGGSTGLHRAIELSAIDLRQEKNKHIIILTDGMPDFCERCVEEMQKKNKAGAKGIGLEITADNFSCSSLGKIVGKDMRKIKEVSTLPGEFENLLKDIIKTLK